MTRLLTGTKDDSPPDREYEAYPSTKTTARQPRCHNIASPTVFLALAVPPRPMGSPTVSQMVWQRCAAPGRICSNSSPIHRRHGRLGKGSSPFGGQLVH